MYLIYGEVSLMQRRNNNGETNLLHELNNFIRLAQSAATITLCLRLDGWQLGGM